MRWNAGHNRQRELFGEGDHDPRQRAPPEEIDEGHGATRRGPEATDTDRSAADADTYRGHTYGVRREASAVRARQELYLLVDGDRVMSASGLEDRGRSFDDVQNWTVALERYGRAFIDGIEE